MLYRELGNTGKKVSILGYGCMRFPTLSNNGDIDEEKSMEMLKYAIDNGVNYLDTAWPYHDKMSEPFVGKFLEKYDLRDKVYLATKLPSWKIESREDMDKYLDKQLEKLKTEYIDFYLIHTLNKKYWKKLKDNGLFDFIDEAKKSGKIKHIGFSFHDDLKTFKKIVDEYDGWEFCQIQLNYLDEERQAGLEGMHYARAKGLGIVIMEPLRGGNLTGKAPEDIEKIFNKAKRKRSLAEWGLKYLWNKREVDIVLSGMTEMEHVEDNIKYASNSSIGCLKKNEENIINEAKKAYLDKIQVNCTECKYCMPCPHNVSIPRSLRFLNEVHMFGDVDAPKKAYLASVDKDNRAHMCIECNECLEKCPQNIEIPKYLGKTANLYKGE